MASVAFAEQPQRVPKHSLIAGHDRPAELLLDRRDDREYRNVGAADQ